MSPLPLNCPVQMVAVEHPVDLALLTAHSPPIPCLLPQPLDLLNGCGGHVIFPALLTVHAPTLGSLVRLATLFTNRAPPHLFTVVAVGHAVDLALLTVRDDSFWVEPAPMLPLALGDVPTLQESVLVIGYPTGGDNTSVTR